MEQILQWVRETPPFTRFYMALAILLSTSTSIGLVSPASLIFVPNKAFQLSQYWRLLTSFLYFGDLNFNLLVHLYFIKRSVGQLEESYITTLAFVPLSWQIKHKVQLQRYFDKFRSIDFFHYMFSMCVSIIFFVTWGFTYRDMKIVQLGQILDDVMLYILCKRNPNLEFMIYFVMTIRSAYFPYVVTLVNWFLSGEMALSRQYFQISFNSGVNHLMKSKFLWQTFICHSVGHFWWFVKDIWMNRLNNNDRKLIKYKYIHEIRKAQTLFNQIITIEFHELVQIILLPPWYWILYFKLDDNAIEQEREEINLDWGNAPRDEDLAEAPVVHL